MKIKDALAQGELLVQVKVKANHVTLKFKNKYNTKKHYPSINKMLYELYHASAAFQEIFMQPKMGKAIPYLTLKKDHGYQSDQEVLDTLMNLAMPDSKKTNHLKVKEALSQGRLFARIERKDKHVVLILQDEYNKKEYYSSINYALSTLYRTSDAFQKKFMRPTTGQNSPFLTLKEISDHENELSILDDLQSFAILEQLMNLISAKDLVDQASLKKRQLLVKKALAEGELIEQALLLGNEVTLSLKSEYNKEEYYDLVNYIFYALYRSSKEFQETFKQPQVISSLPYLILKENHGYQDGKAVLEAIQQFATPKEQLKTKKLLAQGELFESVSIIGNQTTFSLKNAYNKPRHFSSVNSVFFWLYRSSIAFQEKFIQPKIGRNIPCLTLKENHGYQDGKALLEDLQRFAAVKPKKSIEKIALTSNATTSQQKLAEPDDASLENPWIYPSFEITSFSLPFPSSPPLLFSEEAKGDFPIIEPSTPLSPPIVSLNDNLQESDNEKHRLGLF